MVAATRLHAWTISGLTIGFDSTFRRDLLCLFGANGAAQETSWKPSPFYTSLESTILIGSEVRWSGSGVTDRPTPLEAMGRDFDVLVSRDLVTRAVDSSLAMRAWARRQGEVELMSAGVAKSLRVPTARVVGALTTVCALLNVSCMEWEC